MYLKAPAAMNRDPGNRASWKVYRFCCNMVTWSIAGLSVLMFLAVASEDEFGSLQIVAALFFTLLVFLLTGMPVVAKNRIGLKFSRRIDGAPWSDKKLMRLHWFLYAFHIAFVCTLCWMLIHINFGFHLGFRWANLSRTDWMSMISLVVIWMILLPSAYILPMDLVLAGKLVRANRQVA